jgi:hypothetical protein
VARAWLVAALLLLSGEAGAGTDDPPAAAPVTTPPPAPAPDGTGAPRRPEPADKRRIIGVLEVRVDGVPDEVKESFQRALEDKFDAQRYRIASRSLLRQQLMHSTRWTDGCLVGQCLAEVRAQTGADLVLLAALTGSGTSFGYVVTLVRTDTGRVLRQDSERCDVCTVNEAMGKAMKATMALLDKVPATLPDEAAEQHASVDRAVGRVQQDLAERDRHTARLGLALTIVGLAVAVTGATLYALADRPTYAAMTLAGGGALATGGVVVLTF